MPRRLLLAGLLGGLFLSACATRSPVAATPAGETPVATSGQPAAVAGLPTPTLRPGMEATDPTTVRLGDGTPALVEFFAFW
jgi:hypothetical protein